MSTALVSTLLEILPFALLIALSPISLVSIILTLFSGRARQNGPAFLCGWVLGMSLICTGAVLLIEVGESAAGVSPSTLESLGRATLGVALLLASLKQWYEQRQQQKRKEAAVMPKWMGAIDTFSPLKAWLAGLLLSGITNPKNTVLIMAAGMSILHAGLSSVETAKLITAFVLIASLGVLIPLVYFFRGGAAAKTVMKRWQDRLIQHNAMVLVVMLLVFGGLLLGRGLAELLA